MRHGGRLLLDAPRAVKRTREEVFVAGAAAGSDEVSAVRVASPDNTGVAFRMK